MKNKQQPTILMGLTALCIVASLILCGFVIQYTRTLRAAQIVNIQWVEVQNVVGARNMMINELKEKHDPEIQRILQALAMSAAAPAKSPAK